jgi:DNA invertase Pin-like site-specific DNA recombinase
MTLLLTETTHQTPEIRLYHYNKMRDKYAKSKAINRAIAVIKRGEFIYYSNIAKKYKCNYSTLFRRVYKLTKTRKDADLFWR